MSTQYDVSIPFVYNFHLMFLNLYFSVLSMFILSRPISGICILSILDKRRKPIVLIEVTLMFSLILLVLLSKTCTRQYAFDAAKGWQVKALHIMKWNTSPHLKSNNCQTPPFLDLDSLHAYNKNILQYIYYVLLELLDT